MSRQTLFCLDTNILVHCVREDATWTEIRDDYQLLLIEPRPKISIVSSGELRSLALQFHWGEAKLDQMEFVLGYFDEVPPRFTRHSKARNDCRSCESISTIVIDLQYSIPQCKIECISLKANSMRNNQHRFHRI